MAFHVVGLTGGIGSGKSTVAGFFADQGVPVVDADQVARDVVRPGSAGLAEIIETFGNQILHPDGTLDRKALGAQVFGDNAARAKLNAILHPKIGQESMQQLASLAQAGHTYAIYEAALLVENNAYRTMAALVVVAAETDVQRERLQTRDDLNPQEAQARLDAQLPLAEKIKVADFVIWNNTDLETTKTSALQVHQALLRRFDVRDAT